MRSRVHEDLVGERSRADGRSVDRDLRVGQARVDPKDTQVLTEPVEDLLHLVGTIALRADARREVSEGEGDVLGRVAVLAQLELDLGQVAGDVVRLLEPPRGEEQVVRLFDLACGEGFGPLAEKSVGINVARARRGRGTIRCRAGEGRAGRHEQQGQEHQERDR